MAFPKGQKNPNAGRPKGAENKTTLEIKQAFQNLLELNTNNMIGWLKEVAINNPAKALDICGNLAEFVVPKLQRTEMTGKDGGDIEISIREKAIERANRLAASLASATPDSDRETPSMGGTSAG